MKSNERIEKLETSWIVPGVTTDREVLQKLGLPPPVGRADDSPAYLSAESLRYCSQDTRIWKLQLGYILTPIFEQTNTVIAHDISIRFKDGIVTQISRVRRRALGAPEILEFREVTP
ncbi:MAG: hypothetical protein RSD41_04105 [Kiritimatiellia bacterium]